jgi:hypothetical protein
MLRKIKDWLLIILLAIVGVFFMLIFRKKPDWIKKKQKEIKQKENEIDNNVEKIKQSRKEREEKAEELSEDLRKTDYKFRNRFFSMMLIFLLILSPFVMASDGEPPPMSKEDLKIPDTYEELLNSYYDMFDYAMHYREIAYQYEKLYQQEKADSEKLLNEIENLKMLLDMQKNMIDQLMSNNMGLSVGINYVPLHPDYSGVIVQVEYEF